MAGVMRLSAPSSSRSGLRSSGFTLEGTVTPFFFSALQERSVCLPVRTLLSSEILSCGPVIRKNWPRYWLRARARVCSCYPCSSTLDPRWGTADAEIKGETDRRSISGPIDRKGIKTTQGPAYAQQRFTDFLSC